MSTRQQCSSAVSTEPKLQLTQTRASHLTENGAVNVTQPCRYPIYCSHCATESTQFTASTPITVSNSTTATPPHDKIQRITNKQHNGRHLPTTLGLHISYPIFYTDLVKPEFSRQIFQKVPSTKLYENQSRGRGERDGRAAMTKQTRAIGELRTRQKHNQPYLLP